MVDHPTHRPDDAGRRVDPRGVRFSAAMTSAVLALGLATESPRVLLAQAIIFGACAAFGLRANPYGVAYRRTVQPRLSTPRAWTAEAPLRFAQGIGCAFASAGALGYAIGFTTLGALATGCALAAALLNAVFGVCVACYCYPALARIRHVLTA
ncbi:DUF4395 domain-containing protein [Umezawaea sp. Da 62-37]|uniref:DUF4395 domain-containing protein n=1 Tax=Umezawaea sp. Da 62-37 TaxID=3075927 RepID=UPI0028F73749|nr:DUF4395 domain-containing protein [Umezawaea sp. Da 62-37]WNV86120.1 DUF4395 domain-containing protein [Umezawaea sp. Da 62-37]